MGSSDEVRQHLLSDLEIGNDTVLHRTDRQDLARSASQHLLGVAPDGLDAAGLAVHGHDGGFGDDDSLPAGEDESVGRPEVDREIVGQEAEVEKRAKIHGNLGSLLTGEWKRAKEEWVT